jgi:hypothetical protein
MIEVSGAPAAPKFKYAHTCSALGIIYFQGASTRLTK